MIKTGAFRPEDLERAEIVPLDECLTQIMGHILRAHGRMEPLLSIDGSLRELRSMVSRELDPSIGSVGEVVN